MARKILLADDSVTAQNMGRKILSDAGYEVITVNNGSAALKRIAEQRPDLIILDVYMPGYSGLEVCQRLKEVQETARIPVLLTVGKLEPFKPEEAKRVRAEGFIVKPFEASELLSVLSKLEDKIVPRSEPSKPGRFARAAAAVEESSRSKKDQPADEGSAWKKRISFPSRKQAAAESEPQPQAAELDESRVDMTALAAPGAPSDVSADEIAAIAAAAAQVQAAVSAAKETSTTSSTTSSEEKRLTTEASAADAAAQANVAEKIEAKEEALVEARTAAGAPAEPATLAEHVDEAHPSTAAPHGDADVIAALAALEPANGGTWGLPGNGTGRSSAEQADVPVTMASSGPDSSSADSRWVAIPVAMAADEAAISLELEMQKAYAAFAAAEANHPEFVPSASPVETSSQEACPAETSLIPDSTAEVGSPAAPNQEPDLANTANAVANASAEAVSAAAEKLAAVAGSYVETESSLVPTAAGSIQEHTNAVADTATTQIQDSPTPYLEDAIPAPKPAYPGSVDQSQADAPPVSLAAEPATIPDESVSGRPAGTEKKETELTASTAAAWASWRQIRDSGQSRDTDPVPASSQENLEQEEDQPAASTESAAMAVAAGAEKIPVEAEASDADPAAIASIVDSVLADLRPKIVEEISKKLGKKK